MRSGELLSSAITGSALAATSGSVGERAPKDDARAGRELTGCAGADVCSAICSGRRGEEDDSRDVACSKCCKFACDELDADGSGVGEAAGLITAEFVAARVAGLGGAGSFEAGCFAVLLTSELTRSAPRFGSAT